MQVVLVAAWKYTSLHSDRDESILDEILNRLIILGIFLHEVLNVVDSEISIFVDEEEHGTFVWARSTLDIVKNRWYAYY